jgi:hypothetical protein
VIISEFAVMSAKKHCNLGGKNITGALYFASGLKNILTGF